MYVSAQVAFFILTASMMQQKEHSGKEPGRTRHLTARYIVALSLIAFLAITGQVVIQIVLARQAKDAYVINMAGRQRMLSQKISKAALVASLGRSSARDAVQELEQALALWEQSHEALQHGDATLGISGQNSQHVEQMFAALDPYFQAMHTAAHALLATIAEPGDSAEAAVRQQVHVILENEQHFLPMMDRIVQQYGAEATSRVQHLKRIELVLLVITLLVLFLEGLYVFRPAVQGVRHAMERLVRTNKTLQSTNQALTYAKTAAEAAAHAKNDFLAKMSHEIRTPMNGVLGMTELLLGTSLSDQQRRYAETISTSGETLLHLIDDVLDMAKIEAGQIRLEQVPFNLRQLIAETVELFAARAEAKGLRLIVHVGILTPREVIGDPHRLRQVLTNLISNAIKFTEEGAVRIGVSPGEEEAICFHVADTGIGIAPEAQARLFQAFEQVEDATARKYGGTGLGLSISQQLVEMMGGQIEVESEPGKGTTFRFAITLEQVLEVDPPSADGAQFQAMRVLLVGGVATERAIYREQLEQWGFTVDEEASAPGALERLCSEDDEVRYDVVIVDQDTPVLAGLKLIQAVQKSTPGKVLPFLLVSGVGDTVLQEQAVEAGIRCLTRPVRPSDLLNALSAILSDDPFRDSEAELPASFNA